MNGKFQIISTNDGGMSWQLVSQAGMPPAQPGEAGFAASGECLVTGHGHRAWFGAGGGPQARVFRSNDGGKTWQVSATPIPSSPTAGISALAFRDAKHGIAVGGDFLAPTSSPNAVAVTSDGGKTWQLAASTPNRRTARASTVREAVTTAIAVGLAGSDVSTDGGETWTTLRRRAASTPSTAPAATSAGPRARSAASPISSSRQPSS